jgi:hypothetical protein
MRLLLVGLISGITGALSVALLPKFLGEPAVAEGPKHLQVQSLDLVDSSGKLRAQLAIGKEGGSGLWLMDAQGRARVNVGVYADGTGFVVLNDPQGQAVQILRSFGPHETPLHIFKNGGQDKMIMGLNPSDKAPFVMHYDEKRKRNLAFGQYTGP